ncbi:MAG: prolipoprotein diacylglyceryl transferase [Phycisphaerales bacterium]
MTLAAWLHTLSPFAVRFTENFGIRWYGLAYIAGFFVAYLILQRLAARGKILVPAPFVPDAMMWLIGGALVGGRVGYVLVYEQSAIWTFTSSPPWWEVLAINHGGMASHGGMVGIIIGCWRVSRGWKTETGEVVGRCPMLHVMDAAALVAPFGIFFGRIANFINGELLGRIVTPPGVEGPWWSVQFPQELTDGHAPPLTEAQAAQVITLARQYMKPGEEHVTRQSLERLISHASEHAAALKPLLASRQPSQILQALGEGGVVAVVLWILWARKRAPGVIAAAFLFTYGVMRIVTEFSRLPDAKFVHQRFAGLSRGQWLSVGMIIAAGVVFYLAGRARKPAARE